MLHSQITAAPVSHVEAALARANARIATAFAGVEAARQLSPHQRAINFGNDQHRRARAVIRICRDEIAADLAGPFAKVDRNFHPGQITRAAKLASIYRARANRAFAEARSLSYRAAVTEGGL